MMPKTEASGDDAAEEWLTSVNWEEDPAIKAKRRRKHRNDKQLVKSSAILSFSQ